jgi:hypothetical protein
MAKSCPTTKRSTVNERNVDSGGSHQTLPEDTPASSDSTGDTSDSGTTATSDDTTDQINGGTNGDGNGDAGGDAKSPPYNMYVALALIGGAIIVFLLVLAVSIFTGLIKTPSDFATVAGTMGGLFTLLGTVAGAYFGIKSTNDTIDKVRKQVEVANARTERAYRETR